jgi:hypothetical protein
MVDGKSCASTCPSQAIHCRVSLREASAGIVQRFAGEPSDAFFGLQAVYRISMGNFVRSRVCCVIVRAYQCVACIQTGRVKIGMSHQNQCDEIGMTNGGFLGACCIRVRYSALHMCPDTVSCLVKGLPYTHQHDCAAALLSHAVACAHGSQA